MDLLREKLRCTPMGAALPKGSKTESNPVTTNRDNRVANNGGSGVSGDGNLTFTSSDDYSTSNFDASRNDYSRFEDNSVTTINSSDPATLQKMASEHAYVLNSLSDGQADAVKALSSFGAQMVRDSQEAIVDLNATSTAANRDMWDKTVSVGAGLVDKLIGQSGALGQAAISNFAPTENKNADTGKYAMWAAAAVAAVVLLKGSK